MGIIERWKIKFQNANLKIKEGEEDSEHYEMFMLERP